MLKLRRFYYTSGEEVDLLASLEKNIYNKKNYME